MNVKEIVKQWLEANGYDGLAGEDCGCPLDELMACEGLGGGPDVSGCVPGHARVKNKQCDCEHYADCFGSCIRSGRGQERQT